MNKYTKLVILGLIIMSFFRCSIEDNIEPSIVIDTIIEPKDSVVLMGEISLDVPGANYLYRTSSNDYLVTGSGGIINYDKNEMEFYPHLLKLDDSCNVKYKKFPLISVLNFPIEIIEINEHYYIMGQSQDVDNNMLTEGLEMIKTDKDGNVVWYKAYENTSFANSMIVTNDSNILILGSFYPWKPASASPTFLMKVDLDGNILFRKDYTLEENLHFGIKIIEEVDSYSLFSYEQSRTGSLVESTAPMLVKTDKVGNIISKEIYESYKNTGGIYTESTRVIKNSNGGYIFTHFPNDKWTSKSFLKTLDSDGNVLSQVNMDQVSVCEIDYVAQIVQASNDYIYVLGSHNIGWHSSSPSKWNVCVLKFDGNGDYISSKQYFELGHNRARSMVETNEGNFYILTSEPSIFMIDENLEML